jgi:hypothetical protein
MCLVEDIKYPMNSMYFRFYKNFAFSLHALLYIFLQKALYTYKNITYYHITHMKNLIENILQNKTQRPAIEARKIAFSSEGLEPWSGEFN